MNAAEHDRLPWWTVRAGRVVGDHTPPEDGCDPGTDGGPYPGAWRRHVLPCGCQGGTHPYRYVRRRTRGWRTPPGGRGVGRGTRFGNPFPIGGTLTAYDADGAPLMIGGTDWPSAPRLTIDRALAVTAYGAWLAQPRNPQHDRAVRDLAGVPLGCWCPITEPCHADRLLAVANPAVPCLAGRIFPG